MPFRAPRSSLVHPAIGFLLAFVSIRVGMAYFPEASSYLSRWRGAAPHASDRPVPVAERHELARTGEVPDFNRYHQRFAGVIARLPPGVTVGYLSDTPPDQVEGPAQDRDQAMNLLLTRYVLAPHKIVNGPASPWVIGNFDRPEGVRGLPYTDLKLVEDFGNGVALYRREP